MSDWRNTTYTFRTQSNNCIFEVFDFVSYDQPTYLNFNISLMLETNPVFICFEMQVPVHYILI